MVGAWASLHSKSPRTSHIQTSRYVVDLLIWTESASGVAGNLAVNAINFRHHVAFDLAAQMVSLVPSERHSRRAKAYMEAGLAGCWLRIHCVLGELS
jgi:hypothetical protein